MKSPLLRHVAFFTSIACPTFVAASGTGTADALPAFLSWAPSPPMGWNSWDCFATTVTEAQTKEQADFMSAKLKVHGWQYIVVDIQWYEPDAKDHAYRDNAVLTMDSFGRLQPAPNRFPSSADGSGFRHLADYVHSLGLKFGIHLMRGIPRQAVERNLPILGTSFHAQDIADKEHFCPWNPDMYGVDMSKPGAQEYYDSVFALIAEWGVDFVKVDDLSRPYFQNQPEVEAIRRAIDKTGRPIVLSLSPGATDIRAAEHVALHANMWRISDDFWDRWLALKEQFWRLARWNLPRQPGAWPDADMLPLGTLVMGTRMTRFTQDEQITMMTLWSISRSPLMHGGDMSKTDSFTLSLLTNDEVLAVNQHSSNNKQLFDRDGLVAWTATDPASGDTYLALFNARDRVPLTKENASQFASLVTADPASHARIEIDLSGGSKLFFVAEPLAESDAFTQVFWESPTLSLADGSVVNLLSLPWASADAQWDSASLVKDADGKPYRLNALAPAVIEYALPEGAQRLVAKAGVDASAAGHMRIFTVVGNANNEDNGPGLPVEVNLAEIVGGKAVRIRELWTGENLGEHSGVFSPIVPFHGAKLYRLTPLNP